MENMSKLCHFLSLQVAYLLEDNVQSTITGPLENKVFYVEEGKVGPQYLYMVMSIESSLSLEQIWKIWLKVYKEEINHAAILKQNEENKKRKRGNLIYIRKNGILSFFFFFIPVYISTPYLQRETDRWNW